MCHHLALLGRVDLSGLNFVRIKCIFIAALVIRIVILRTEQVPIIMLLHNLSTCIHTGINEKNAFKRIQGTALMMPFYCVIAYLCGMTTRHKLCLV